MSIVRAVLPLLVVLAACDPREPEADAEPPTEPRVASRPRAEVASPPRAAAPRIDPAPYEVRLAALHDRGDTIEIELDLGRPLPPTNASRPTLHVGDEIVRKSRHPGGRLDRLVFLVPRDQFDRMSDGAALELRGVVLARGAVPVAPVLDKSALRAP
jgi:hypothetical protein